MSYFDDNEDRIVSRGYAHTSRSSPQPLPKWKTADGKKIAVRDMDDNHLLNALRYLERKAEEWGQSHPTLPIYKIMKREAHRRSLGWRPRAHDRCVFRVRVDKGDHEDCGAGAVMLAPPAADGRQYPYCQEHRPDALAHHGRECDGCFAKGREFVVDVPGDGQERLLFCGDCATSPEGPFAAWLTFLILILTLGRVRL